MKNQHLRDTSIKAWLTSFLPGERRFFEVNSSEVVKEMKRYHSRICEIPNMTFSTEALTGVWRTSDKTVTLLCVTRTDGVVSIVPDFDQDWQ